MDCIFCKIASGEMPCHKIYEDKDFVVFLDIKPVNAGHTLIMPKAHHENLMDLPEKLAQKMIALAKKLAPAILSAVDANSFNLTMNNGVASGQSVPHAHIHIIPRIEEDGLIPWGGRGDYSEKESQELLEKIEECLK